MCIKTCFYQEEKSGVEEYFKDDDLLNMGFSNVSITGPYQEALGYLSKNKIDIFIADISCTDKERFEFIIDIIYSNFCHKILLIGSTKFKDREGVKSLSTDNMKNFDLLLTNKLLEIKRDIEDKPSRNMPYIKSKISDIMLDFKFNNKLDGFKYYVEAVTKMYFKFPSRCSMMEIYEEVGSSFGKSSYAIEKSMRSALLAAIRHINALPSTPDNTKLQSVMAYDMNNKTTTNMIVSKLIQDKDISDSLENGTKEYVYQ